MDLAHIDPVDVADKNIFGLLGLQDASQERKDAITANMMKTVQNRILARVIDSLTEDSQQKLEQLIAMEDEQEVEDFLRKVGVDIARIATEEALNYKVEIVNLVNKRSAR